MPHWNYFTPKLRNPWWAQPLESRDHDRHNLGQVDGSKCVRPRVKKKALIDGQMKRSSATCPCSPGECRFGSRNALLLLRNSTMAPHLFTGWAKLECVSSYIFFGKNLLSTPSKPSHQTPKFAGRFFVFQVSCATAPQSVWSVSARWIGLPDAKQNLMICRKLHKTVNQRSPNPGLWLLGDHLESASQIQGNRPAINTMWTKNVQYITMLCTSTSSKFAANIP